MKPPREPGGSGPAVGPGPVDEAGRLEVLDAVRGFALGGVLLANLVSFAGHYVMTPAQTDALPTAPVDRAVLFGVDFLVEGKFYSLFSLLFGVGFSLQQGRARARGAPFAPLFRRRMVALLAIGLAHLFLLWHGDILALYAVMGLVLVAFRGASDRALVRWAVALVWLPLAWQAVIWFSGGALDPLPPSKALAGWVQGAWGGGQKTLFELRSSRDPGEVFLGNLVNALWRPGRYLETGRPAKVLAMFLLGAWAGRRLVADPELRGVPLGRVVARGLALGLVGNGVYAAVEARTGSSFSLSALGLVQTAGYALGVAPLALAYAAALALAWRRERSRRWLAAFVPLGRMAITNYLAQTLIGLALFYGYGLNLMGRLGAAWLVPLAGAILLAQGRASAVWLAHYRYGPVEWVWRQLTYGRRLPLGRAAGGAPRRRVALRRECRGARRLGRATRARVGRLAARRGDLVRRAGARAPGPAPGAPFRRAAPHVPGARRAGGAESGAPAGGAVAPRERSRLSTCRTVS
jgi:uncharacterized protein